ncbi:MAG: DUF192 domain-containing protein [Verrucomicrobiota bacterium]
MNYSRSIILLLFAFIACTGCEQQSSQRLGATVDGATLFPIKVGAKMTQLELALNDSERAKGLMFRESLKADHGMLFIFKDVRKQSFWMRNTPLPLDLGYFDASGRLIEIRKLYPHDETAIESRSSEILMALEMEQGWFQANDVKPGDKIDLNAVKEGIIARGFSPDRFLLN